MPRVRVIQQRFTQGELDPRMFARVDIDQYYGALAKARNVFPIPQGGFTRRPGLQYLGVLPNQITRKTGQTITAVNGGTTANANDNNTATLVTTTNNISTTNPYVVAQYDLGSAQSIAFIDVVAASLSAGVSSEFAIQVSNDASAWTTLRTVNLSTTASTRRVRCMGSYRYVRWARVGATDLGTAKASIGELWVWLDSGTLSDSRYIDFAFNTDQTYMLVHTDFNLAVYKNGVLQTDIPVYSYPSAQLNLINWTQSADTLLLFNPLNQPYKVQRIADNDWNSDLLAFDYIPNYNFVPAETNPAQTLTPSGASGNVTLTAGGGTIFSAASVNQYISGNGGRARIAQYVSATVVKAVLEIPFFDTTAMASGSWTYETGYEPTWSTTRGWPNCGVFHEGRLWIGGSNSRPSTLWGSRVGLFFDFDPGSLLDDDAIEATLDTGQFNKILNLYSGRALQIFTTGAEHAVLQQLNDPITPTNFNAKRQTSVGSKEGLRVVEVEGSVIYVQRQGESIQEFIFSDTQQAFVNNIVSLLSSHLIAQPVDFCLRKSTSTAQGNYLVSVNSDGSLAVASILRSQNITAFTPQDTDGLFKRAGVDVEDIYFTVERVINGSTVRYIERFNFDYTTDCAQQFLGAHASVSGLSYVEGELVKVRADDSMLDDETVASAAITLSRDSVTYVEVGLDYVIDVRDLPVEVPQIGTAVGLKKNISEVDLQLYETQNIMVNGKVLSFESFGPSGGGSPLDAPPVSFTGLKRIKGFRGWDFTAQIDISQNQPMPMTVLAIVKRVKV